MASSGPLRVLSLDGGGIRGVSSLLVLEDVMEKLRDALALDSIPRPCEFFDLIGGTSTGGIIAIMLGRLRMTVDECIRAYKEVAQEAFTPKRSTVLPGSPTGSFSTKVLEAAIKKMVRKFCVESECAARRNQGLPTTETCPHSDVEYRDKSCTKTVVLAITKDNVGAGPMLFTTYDTSARFDGCSIWQVARATSAATTFFKPITVGRDGVEFVDAGFGYNNPCEVLLEEARRQFPRHGRLQVLSIGTGLGDVVSIGDTRLSIINALKEMATSSEQVAARLDSQYGDGSQYYRLNVDQGLQDVTLSDWEKSSTISAHTYNYLRKNQRMIKKLVDALAGIIPGLEAQVGRTIPTIRGAVEGGEDGTQEMAATSPHSPQRAGVERSGAGAVTEKPCLVALRTTDPRHDKTRIEGGKGGLLDDVCRWVLSNDEFRRWRHDKQNRLLWIKGDPGKGKTMLLCGLINELKNEGVLAYFFCQAADPRINSATAVVRGLIYLLVDSRPSLLSHLQQRYDRAGRQLFEDVNAWVAVREIFLDILNTLDDPALPSPYLVVDALDECQTGLSGLLDLIASGSAAYRAKWIVSSRNWPEIEERLAQADQKVPLSLELNANSVSAAVQLYVQEKARTLAERKQYDLETTTQVEGYLAFNASNTFLWVALVCQTLDEVPAFKALKTLHTFPPGLDALYGRMMQSICGMEDLDDVALCIQILSVASTVYRPLTLEELASFVNHPSPDIQLDNISLKHYIGLCRSFLAIGERTVSFVHQSAKDFLCNPSLNTAFYKVFPHTITGIHQNLFSKSLQLLSRTLQHNIYGLSHPGTAIEDVTPPSPDPIRPVLYSCLYWVDHLIAAQAGSTHIRIKDLQDGGDVHAFLSETYLHWLEALSLARAMLKGVLAIEKLNILLQHLAKGSQLSSLVWDMGRFALSHQFAIENAPLQAYASALVFSPAQSLTRQLFQEDYAPRWLVKSPTMGDDWSSCVATFKGHSSFVYSVAFSPDGRQLASASADGTVKLWDARAGGGCVATFEGHSHGVSSVAFSPDGQQLASASWDRTVKLWDAYAGGRCVATFEGHNHWVNSVAFSPDGRQLASASADGTVKLWDARAGGGCVMTFEGHSHGVSSVAFSPDGRQLASASYDTTIKLWAICTGGGCMATFEGHRFEVNSVTFSPDGRQLASASNDKTIKLWDIHTGGDCVTTFEGHSDFVNSVAFSPDGRQLVSASSGDTVKLWDIRAGGSCVATFEGHSRYVNSVAFSPDGCQLASASGDMTVKLWDAYVGGGCVATFEGHSFWVNSITFSPNGRQLASASADETVKLWDAYKGGGCITTFEGHSGFVNSVAFSPDGRQLASADDTVKLWDTCAGGGCVATFEGHSGPVNSVAFSPDGCQLASASYDKTVKLWDIYTGGRCMATFEGHSGWVNSVAFSPDGRQLASASNDKTVKLWDVRTGGGCMATFEGHSHWVGSVAFSPDGSCLQTDIGIVLLSKSPTNSALVPVLLQPPCVRGHGVSTDGAWITYNGRNLLWLPPEYRPKMSTVAGSTVALGFASGRVLIFRFSEEEGLLP